MIIKQKIQLFSTISAFILFFVLFFGVIVQAQWVEHLNTIGQQMIQHRSSIADNIFINATQLGNVTFISILTIILALIFIYHRQYRLLYFLLVNVVLFAGIVTQVIKRIVQNPRPLPQLVTESGYSFPSGHTMIAILLYGSLIIIVHAYLHNNWLKYIILLTLSVLIILIPLSRIYVNVHYPSDILAGLSLGYGLLMTSQYIFHIGGSNQ
ncbi:phosphatase PAP2 family protein [Leuconostoc miyukkimchii]|uniref:phosphatase PAP2 family protein n=1 Tax=Leuconostoc miyukkimchii TaxID=910540 RepID=UPI001C7D9F47|nr:phosphatase PAP2 family protein [Leuconostoc miyukkimchii]